MLFLLDSSAVMEEGFVFDESLIFFNNLDAKFCELEFELVSTLLLVIVELALWFFVEASDDFPVDTRMDLGAGEFTFRTHEKLQERLMSVLAIFFVACMELVVEVMLTSLNRLLFRTFSGHV